MIRRSLTALAVLAAAATMPAGAWAQGDAARGKASYEAMCTSCHGATGKGDGAAAAALDPRPRDLSDKGYMSGLADAHLFKVIKEGGAGVGKSPLMPPWGGALSDDQIRDVVAYVKTLSR